MTHHEAFSLLLELARGEALPRDETRRAALEEHVARCADCCAHLEALRARGGGMADPDRLTALFGCEPVRSRFHALVRLDEAAMRRVDPEAASHLAWCLACRERFATLAELEDAYAGAPDAEPAGGVGIAPLVAVVRAGIAAFVELTSPGLGLPAVEGARRDGGEDLSPFGSRTTQRILGPDLTVTFEVRPRQADGVDLVIRPSPARAGGMVALVSRDRPAGIVGLYSIPISEPVLVRGLVAGRYTLRFPGASIDLDVRIA